MGIGIFATAAGWLASALTDQLAQPIDTQDPHAARMQRVLQALADPASSLPAH